MNYYPPPPSLLAGSVLAGLKAAWGEFKGGNSWRSDVACSALQGITCDTNGTETHIVAM